MSCVTRRLTNQHRADDAIEQFRALQAIDPDDLAAHYNLAILYRRKGMKHQAEVEAAMYAMKRIEPAAPTYSLDLSTRAPGNIDRECDVACA
jgi:hypothetical protein